MFGDDLAVPFPYNPNKHELKTNYTIHFANWPEPVIWWYVVRGTVLPLSLSCLLQADQLRHSTVFLSRRGAEVFK